MDVTEVKPVVPARYRHSAVPHLMLADASAAVEFYKAAFGASEVFRIADPSGKIVHGEIEIGHSIVMVGDVDDRFSEPGSAGGTTVGVHVYVDDVDAMFARAVHAGITVLQEPQDMFYGDRTVMLKDPFGHIWVFLQPLEPVEPDAIVERANALFRG